MPCQTGEGPARAPCLICSPSTAGAGGVGLDTGVGGSEDAMARRGWPTGRKFPSGDVNARRLFWARLGAVALFTLLIAGLVLPATRAPAAEVVSGVVEVRVGASSDDAEELSSGWLDLRSSDLELVFEKMSQVVGLRFVGVGVPAGATVDAAWVQFTVDEPSTGPADLVVWAEDVGNAATFSAGARITSRVLTSVGVGWVPAPWPTVGAAGVEQRTADLSAVVEAVVGRGDWVAGNALVLVVTGSGTRTAESFDGSAAPLLHVEWHVGGGTTTTTTTTAPPTTTTTTTTVPPTPGTTARFAAFGDYGTGWPSEAAVAALVHSLNVDFIVTTGDNIQLDGTYDDLVGAYYSSFIGAYQGVHGPGSAVNRFFPALGNHDYTNGGGVAAYYDFFTLPGDGFHSTSGTERYYDFVWGPVHFFVLDAYTQTTVQRPWLEAGLAASTAPWQIVVLHFPPYSSGGDGSSQWMQWPYDAWGADAVLSGHTHQYERILRDDDGDGIPLLYIVSGLGGADIRAFDTPVAGSVARYNATHGSLVVDACDTGMAFAFHAVGGAVVDQYLVGTPCP